MADYSTKDIRNVALVGHSGSGKTSLAEALLLRAGAIRSGGSVEKGSTVSDDDPLEKEHQHSLRSGVLHLDYRNTHINLIDTPGYPDFVGQTLSVLPAVEAVAVVINAQNGIETLTRRLMKWAGERKLCRMIIVNKIDAAEVDLPALMLSIQDAFGKECLPINLPADGGKKVVDCFFNPSGDADFSSVDEAHTAVIDQTVEVDEDLMSLYLEKGEVSPEQLHDPFEKALREGHLVPVCFVSAREGTGVEELLDVFTRLMPDPTEGNPRPFMMANGTDDVPITMKPDPDAHIIGHVFKVSFDPYLGKVGIFRIHQGTVTRDSELYVNDSRKAFKVGHLLELQGGKSERAERGIPGDIRAVTKVPEIHFDSVLHNFHEEDGVHLKPLNFPEPLVGQAVSARTRGDEQKLSEALHKVAEEDACIRVDHDPAANETVLWGLGNLHLRITLERMEKMYRVAADTHPPTVPYRETIVDPAKGRHRHKKQSGGAGQFAEVQLSVEPLERGAGFEFVSRVVGGTIPTHFIPSVEKGTRQAMRAGVLAGFQMQDIRVVLHEGKFHAVDSNEVSFVTAGKRAFMDAVSKAGLIVLEPIVNIEVTVTNEHVGDVTGDLASRRGRILSTEALSDGRTMVVGQAPQAEVTDYQSNLRSMTGGEGTFSLEFAQYEPVPERIQDDLVAERGSVSAAHAAQDSV